jgi:hypothetical protein
MFELYYSTGGHGGPYATLAEAEDSAVDRIRGQRSLDWVNIKDRETGRLIGTIERVQVLTPPVIWVKPLRPVGPADKPNAQLLGTVRILGTEFHVNAEQVHDVDDASVGKTTEGGKYQTTVIAEEETFAPEIWQFCDGAGQTVRIGSRDYLLAMTPFHR